MRRLDIYLILSYMCISSVDFPFSMPYKSEVPVKLSAHLRHSWKVPNTN